MGYCFINLLNSNDIKQFYLTFHDKKWELFKSRKVCEIKYARIQGKQELEKHFKNTNIYNH